jgi:hypothetical protein
LLALSILSLVIAAVYSSWIGIVKASKAGVEAAASAQRERMAMRVVEEALGSVQLFVANPRYYSFVPDKAVTDGADTLSFVARLPKSFPRSGKFGDFDVRRVTFSVEAGENSKKQLVLRQRPILVDEMDEDEKVHPVLLARDVKKFVVEYWDQTAKDWTDEWTLTNQLPKMVQVTLQLNYQGTQAAIPGEIVTRVVSVPTAGVQPTWQVPTLAGGGRVPPPSKSGGLPDRTPPP